MSWCLSLALAAREVLSKGDTERKAFADLPIGARFRLPTPVGYVGGIYFKTGAESYGLRPDEALWEWLGEDHLPVEVVPAWQLHCGPNTFDRGRGLGFKTPSPGAIPSKIPIATGAASPAAVFEQKAAKKTKEEAA